MWVLASLGVAGTSATPGPAVRRSFQRLAAGAFAEAITSYLEQTR